MDTICAISSGDTGRKPQHTDLAHDQSSMADPGTVIAGAELAIKLIEFLSSPFGYLQARFTGAEILIVGQERSGKTAFFDYLEYKHLRNEGDTDKTPGTIISKRVFQVRIGDHLHLTIRAVGDTSGQVGPVEHAQIAFKRRPTVIVVFTDSTTPLEDLRIRDGGAKAWLSQFCDHLENLWRMSRKRNRLRSLVIVVNKADKLSQGDADSRTNILRSIVQEKLRFALGPPPHRVKVLPCVTVNSPWEKSLVDNVIAEIAISIQRASYDGG